MGVLIKLLAKGRTQTVLLSVEQAIDKVSAISLGQIERKVAKKLLKLGQHWFKRVAFAYAADRHRTTNRHILWSIGAHDQNPLAGKPPAQVEKQADRPVVRPL
jgi:hypothetical protein